jgi:cytochrome c-type biogenesis protein CcmH/NrfG
MLYLSNIKLEQDRRRRRLESTKERFDLDKAKYEIRLTASEDNLGDRILDAIQAVQSISSLALTRQRYTSSDFHDEVDDYLNSHGHHYERNVKVVGAVDDHRVDYRIQNGRPIYMQALHAENASSAHSMAIRTQWKWTDIAEAVSDVFRISVIDDESGETDERADRILKEYSDAYVPWSQRSHLQETLAQI